MQNQKFDVLIVGAGAAGLIAALEVSLTGRTVAVIEAADRCGGRMHTVISNGFPVELGAEFVHGNLPVTLGLLKKAGAKTITIGGSYWQHKEGRLTEQEDVIEDEGELEKKLKALQEDVPVSDFLSTHFSDDKFEGLRFSLENYVQGYYAADPAKSSTVALRDELFKGEEKNYRIEGGYQTLVDYLEKACRDKGVQFFLSQPVQRIQWSANETVVHTNAISYSATKAMITVSVGVLASESIAFSPVLPDKIAAAKRLGFGVVVKVILEFEDAFWKDKSLTRGKDLSNAVFLFSEESIPTWWTQHPKEEAVLVGWLGGPQAEAFAWLDKAAVEQKALSAISRIFNLDVLHLSQKLRASHFYNWQSDPHFCGTYSYEVVAGEALQKTVLAPIENAVYFAGEGLHLGPEIGTVEAALQSGQTVARQLIADFSKR